MYSLRARTVAASRYQADLSISLHINANENFSPHVSETRYCSETASSEEAAKGVVYENPVFKYGEPHKKKEGYIDIEKILFNFEQPHYWNEIGRFAKILQERLKQGFCFKAAACIQKAVSFQLDPGNAETYYFLGAVYNFQHNPAMAIEYLKKCRNADCDEADTHFRLAKAFHNVDMHSQCAAGISAGN